MTEEAALICTFESGGLDVRFVSKRLRRQVAAAADASTVAAAVDAEATPLAIPKKSKLFLEFAKRERESAQEMYHTFQQCADPHGPLRRCVSLHESLGVHQCQLESKLAPRLQDVLALIR